MGRLIITKRNQSQLSVMVLVTSKNVLITFVIEQEEPYEGRLSRKVPWERRGETPLRDPTMANV